MAIAELLIILLEAAHICLYMRALRACIGKYRVSQRLAAVLFTALWMFEGINRCMIPAGQEVMLLDFFLFLVEIPVLFVLSFCYQGGMMRRLLMAVSLPFLYWVGKWGIVNALFSFPVDAFRYLAATAADSILLGILVLAWEKAESSRQERERGRLEQELRMYENQFAIIRQSQQNIRSLKHDMKHHIKMLNDMIMGEEKEAALEYLTSMGAFMENNEQFVDSGNEKIDGILNYLISKAKESGIEIDWKIQIPEHLEIPAFDINVILSNLFENAMNALAEVAEPSLYFLMKYDRGVLCISTQNKFSHPGSASRDSEIHGFGLKNIRRITEKYHGSLTTTNCEGVFHASVLLYLEAADSR